jgi:cytochrome c-type biogenesis protein CcmH/NrfG
MLAARRNEWAGAERYFTQSLRFDPADAKTWFSLAEARDKQGNKAGAIAAVERARQLLPGHADIEALYKSLKARP